ncbi:5'/3'-nucleotidase SurE [bacterium]|nr:5'/3'-nucleotidase SurE [bacterium]
MLRVLLANDDGIANPGLRALASQLAPRAEMLVVAPDGNKGAKSHSVTLHKPVRLRPVAGYAAVADTSRFSAYACSGTPADCVMLGALHLWKDNPPDLVISGINDGENVAQDLSYSGTVGAALEGVCCEVPSIALSTEGYDTVSPQDTARAAELVIALLVYGRVFAHQAELAAAWRANGASDNNGLWRIPKLDGAPADAPYPRPGEWYPAGLDTLPCLNINLPARPITEIRGVLWTRAGHRKYYDVVKPGTDPRGRDYFWVAGDKVLLEDEHVGTDTFALAHGYVSVTPLSYDRTNQVDLDRLRDWRVERNH